VSPIRGAAVAIPATRRWRDRTALAAREEMLNIDDDGWGGVTWKISEPPSEVDHVKQALFIKKFSLR
jgi:hypothetical protein